MPVLALVVGVLVCVWSLYGALALNLFWLIIFAAGACSVVWGANRLWWRRGPPTRY